MMGIKKTKTVVVIVAHPDDETLWAGGTILSHPEWKCLVVCLCRKSDAERAARFENALKVLGVDGVMGDLDDGPHQHPLKEKKVEKTILELLPETHFDLVITHSLLGEYTRHLRHEEISKAVMTLWHNRKIEAKELWTFAYEDGNKEYLPQAIKTASQYKLLPEMIWKKKYDIITNEFGFEKDSWEAKTTPKGESFWQFTNTADAMYLLMIGGIKDESIGIV